MQDEQPQAEPLAEDKDKTLPEDKRETERQDEKETTEEKIVYKPAPEESKELAESKEEPLTKKRQRKVRKKLKKPENQTNKNKIIIIDGQEVLMIPSSFEIMTKNGYKPVMMRADKIK